MIKFWDVEKQWLTMHRREMMYMRVHESVVTACWPVQGSQVETPLFFEIPSGAEFQPPCSALRIFKYRCPY